MKTTIFLILFAVASISGGHLSKADVKDDLAAKYYDRFQTTDMTGANILWLSFTSEVPHSDLDEVMARIIDKSAKNSENSRAAGYMFDDLATRSPQTPWPAHLEQVILALTKDKDPVMRAETARVLSANDRVKYRDVCLSFLEDSDDYVRYRAVRGISKWPDAQSILSQYVQKNSSNSEHTKSVDLAKSQVTTQ